jgi:hypothetical protein
VRVFLSGEGPDDLGDWFVERQNRSDPPHMGVIEALLRKVATVELKVAEACAWKRIRKYKSGKHARPETRNVLGLAVQAEETGCDALVFVRDQDGYADRQADVDEGVRLVRERGFALALVGGVAVQEIEAWILALMGERGSQRHADAKAVLAEKHGIRTRAEKVATVESESADHTKIAEDAVSLRGWLAMAGVAFGAEK